MNRKYNYNPSYRNRKPEGTSLPFIMGMMICAIIVCFATIFSQKSETSQMMDDINIMKGEIERLSEMADSLSAKKEAAAPPKKAAPEKKAPKYRRPEREAKEAETAPAPAPAADTTKTQ